MPKVADKGVQEKAARERKAMLEQKFQEELLELVREKPVLYRKDDKNYRDKGAKTKEWLDIAAKMKRPVEAVQNEWKKLRESYAKESKFRALPSGSGGDGKRKGFRFYDTMAWLQPFVKPRNSKSTCFEDSQNDSHNDSQNDSQDQSQDSMDTTLGTGSLVIECDQDLIEIINNNDNEEGPALFGADTLQRRSSTPISPQRSRSRSPIRTPQSGPKTPRSAQKVQTPVAQASHLVIISPQGQYKANSRKTAAAKRSLDMSVDQSLKQVASAIKDIAEGRMSKRKSKSPPAPAPSTLDESIGINIGQNLNKIKDFQKKLMFRNEAMLLLNRLESIVHEQDN